MGRYKRDQPLSAKESVGPALMVAPTASAPESETLAQYTAQAHPDPAVQRRECRRPAVLEIFKPAHDRPIDLVDDRLQAVTVCALGLENVEILEAFYQILFGKKWYPSVTTI
jgi:hypothetical protein